MIVFMRMKMGGGLRQEIWHVLTRKVMYEFWVGIKISSFEVEPILLLQVLSNTLTKSLALR